MTSNSPGWAGRAGVAFGVIALLIIGWVGRPLVAQQDPFPRPMFLETPLSDVLSRDDRTRERAAMQLEDEYTRVTRHLAEMLRDDRESGKLDRGWDGHTHRIMLVVGRWRATECTGELARLLTFQLDRKTIPHGGKVSPSAIYPAATALAAVGDRYATQMVLARVRAPENDETIAVATWVLWKIHGERMARAILRDAIEDAQVEQEKANLAKSLDRISKGESLLP